MLGHTRGHICAALRGYLPALLRALTQVVGPRYDQAMQAGHIRLHIWIPGGREVNYYCGAGKPVRASIAPDWVLKVNPEIVCKECLRQLQLRVGAEAP